MYGCLFVVKCPCGPYKCVAPHANANTRRVCLCCHCPVFLPFLLLILFALWPLGESEEGLRSERSRGGYCELKVVDCSEAVGEGLHHSQNLKEGRKFSCSGDVKTSFEKLILSYSFTPGLANKEDLMDLRTSLKHAVLMWDVNHVHCTGASKK